MTKEKLLELGFQSNGTWCNREVFSLSKESKFSIIEHNGEYGLLDPFTSDFAPIWANLTDEEIIDYISLVKIYEDIYNHPKDYTLYSYMEVTKKIIEFINKIK